MQAEAVTSFLPLKPLFKLNFRPKQNEEIVTCLAEHSVRNRRQIHPLLLRFLHQETKNKESVFLEKQSLKYTQNTSKMALYSMHILITTHLVNGMIGLCWILMHQKMILTIQSIEKVDIMIRASTLPRFYVFCKLLMAFYMQW